MNKFKTIEIFTTTRNQNLFSLYDQALDEQNQIKNYLISKLGTNYKSTKIIPNVIVN